MISKKPAAIATARKATNNLAKPKIAQYNRFADGRTVQKWFSDALKSDDAKPSLAACEKLAREFQITINRQNNAELESCGSVPLPELKDVSPAEYLDRKVQKVISAANQVLVAARELKAYHGNYCWTDNHSGAVSLEDIEDMLRRIGAVPRAPNPHAKTGRPPERWHEVARLIAPAIKAALQEARYRGSLSMIDEKSAVVHVGAAAINWAYKLDVEAAGFASAMRRRDRRKRNKTAGDFASWFPDAMRIKVL